MFNRFVLSALAVSAIWAPRAAFAEGPVDAVPDTPFVQEYHEAYFLCETGSADCAKEMNDVRAVAVDSSGNVFAATKAGALVLGKKGKAWIAIMDEANAGPTFDVAVDTTDTCWIGAWNGLYSWKAGTFEKVRGIDGPIQIVCVFDSRIFAFTRDGLWIVDGGAATHHPFICAGSLRGATPDPKGGWWIATGAGLFHVTPAGDDVAEYRSVAYRNGDEILSSDVQGVAYADDGTLWAGGLGGITMFRDGKRTSHISTDDRVLPSIFVQSINRGPDGRMWIGTRLGVVRFDGKDWSLRHSRRWLVDDEVRDVAFDTDGTAWIATAGGVSAIKRKTMTLSEKAEFMLDASLTRHMREPGFVEACLLRTPGDLDSREPRDDDNDGQYTAMYLVMESYRYAVTKDPQAQANAKKAFGALSFLQTVTDTAGFVARTVIPVSWTRMNHPNENASDKEWADRQVEDPRYKRVDIRWRPSKDGKWLWKGDTSSDEMTGHMYAYPLYYDLAADRAEKEKVRGLIRRIMDYIVDNGYVLNDIDGKHTRWGVWAPERLNKDPDWALERGINSLEILSYLKGAYHVTGDEKYQAEYLRLLKEHDYASNVRRAKNTEPATRTHIDDELAALAYMALLNYEQDPELRALYRESLDWWHENCREDQSPFFNFVYAALAREMDRRIDQSINFLRDAPLDLVRWTVDNSKREDVRLVRAPEVELIQTDRLLPASERGVIRWDQNPWRAVHGENGHTESTSVFWLLPYWMGRYYGFIQQP